MSKKHGRVPSSKREPTTAELAMEVLYMYWLTVAYMELPLEQTDLTLGGVNALLAWQMGHPERASELRAIFLADPEGFARDLRESS